MKDKDKMLKNSERIFQGDFFANSVPILYASLPKLMNLAIWAEIDAIKYHMILISG